MRLSTGTCELRAPFWGAGGGAPREQPEAFPSLQREGALGRKNKRRGNQTKRVKEEDTEVGQNQKREEHSGHSWGAPYHFPTLPNLPAAPPSSNSQHRESSYCAQGTLLLLCYDPSHRQRRKQGTERQVICPRTHR